MEGAVLIREAIAGGWEIETEFVAPGAQQVSGAPAFELAEGVLERVASTERPQPNLATVRMREQMWPLDDVAFVVVADRLGDPGNLGTILRSSEAAGVDAVVLTPGSVDPFNPKVVRASAGALFHVPGRCDPRRGPVPSGRRHHTEIHRSGRLAIVLGNEAHGVAEDALVDRWVRIEHRGRTESLNVAMAATLLVFEAARQRHSPTA